MNFFWKDRNQSHLKMRQKDEPQGFDPQDLREQTDFQDSCNFLRNIPPEPDKPSAYPHFSEHT